MLFYHKMLHFQNIQNKSNYRVFAIIRLGFVYYTKNKNSIKMFIEQTMVVQMNGKIES